MDTLDPCCHYEGESVRSRQSNRSGDLVLIYCVVGQMEMVSLLDLDPRCDPIQGTLAHLGT